MNSSLQNNHAALSSSLFELCATRSTGTLFIKTSNNDTALFVLDKGVITDLSLGLNRGLEAIRILKNEIYKHIEFHENYFEPMANDTKVTCSEDLLTYLGYKQHIPRQKPSTVICYLLA